MFFLYLSVFLLFFFFFNDTATAEIYTLSLHDALPIRGGQRRQQLLLHLAHRVARQGVDDEDAADRKSTRLNSSHRTISNAVFCSKKKTKNRECLTLKEMQTTKKKKKLNT